MVKNITGTNVYVYHSSGATWYDPGTVTKLKANDSIPSTGWIWVVATAEHGVEFSSSTISVQIPQLHIQSDDFSNTVPTAIQNAIMADVATDNGIPMTSMTWPNMGGFIDLAQSRYITFDAKNVYGPIKDISIKIIQNDNVGINFSCNNH